MCFSGVCGCECISVCILGLIWISVSVTWLVSINNILFFWFVSSFCCFWMLWSMSQCKEIHKEICWKNSDLHLSTGSSSVMNSNCLPSVNHCDCTTVSLWPLNFSVVQISSAANVTAKAGSTGFVLDVILSPLPMATPPAQPPRPHQPNKARQMISICPLQSVEEVIDTIRQMMSRICQQSLWMTKTAHLLPLPSFPLLT